MNMLGTGKTLITIINNKDCMYENVLSHFRSEVLALIYIHLDCTTPKGPKITPNEPPKTEKSAKEDRRVERKQSTDIPLNFYVLDLSILE